MANDKRLCKLPYTDSSGVTKEYDFRPRDITTARLLQAEQWYGRDYGAYLPFVQLFLQGDAKAILCAMWIVLSKSGINREPQYLDISVSDVFDAIQRQNAEDIEAARAEGEQADPPTEPALPATETTSDSPSPPSNPETGTSGS